MSILITCPDARARDTILATGGTDGMEASYARLESLIGADDPSPCIVDFQSSVRERDRLAADDELFKADTPDWKDRQGSGRSPRPRYRQLMLTAANRQRMLTT